ncbi:MAG: hypothetical protein RLZZ338_3209 [Cyanobacteriota bacterium]|jgi:hypothetical protein
MVVSVQLLELEKSLQGLSLEEKLWLLEKLFLQLREGIGTENFPETNKPEKTTPIQYDSMVKPIWEVAVDIGENIPESEWAKVPKDLSKNFDFYQDLGE